MLSRLFKNYTIMKNILRTLLILIIVVLNLQVVFSQQRFKKEKLLFDFKKELIRSLKIKSKSLYVYNYINNELIKHNKKNLAESCLYDTNGNKSEDYYSSFDGKTYKVNYFYNENGLLTQAVQSVLGGSPMNITVYFYDNNNNLIKESKASNLDTFDITIYEYNENNFLIRKISHGEHVITYQYEYDNLGNLVNTIEDNWFEKTHNYSRALIYNNDSMITECKNYSDMILQSTFSYKYDNRNNLIEENIHWEDMHKDRKSVYGYNENGNVTSYVNYEGIEKIFNSRFIYDSNGLLIEKINLDTNDKVSSIYKYVYEYY
jgi:hypothetical protein